MSITNGIIKRAIAESRKSEYIQKVGCVIFKGKRILSTGYNQIRTCSGIHNKYKKYTNSLHAEQHACMGIDWHKLKGSDILVVRTSGVQGLLTNARPCPMCYDILKVIGIKRIFFSDAMGKIKEL